MAYSDPDQQIEFKSIYTILRMLFFENYNYFDIYFLCKLL